MGVYTIFIPVFWVREKLGHMPRVSMAIKWQEWKLVPGLAPPNP